MATTIKLTEPQARFLESLPERPRYAFVGKRVNMAFTLKCKGLVDSEMRCAMHNVARGTADFRPAFWRTAAGTQWLEENKQETPTDDQ